MLKDNKPFLPRDSALEGELLYKVCTHLKPAELLHENDWFAVFNRAGFYTVELKSVPLIVLPIVDDEAVVMVRAKRPVLNDSPLELPAGNLEKGEILIQAAARELSQETGIEIKDLSRFKQLPPMLISPNRNPRSVYVFQVDVTQEEFETRLSHDDEIKEVVFLKFERFCELLINGEVYISTPAAIIARHLLFRNILHLKSEGNNTKITKMVG